MGNPDERFSEDALRILRALRFASTYQFRIDGRTAESIHKNKHKLKHIAAERICSELCKMLQGKGILDVLLAFGDVFAFIIPELAPCVGFAQNNRFHPVSYTHLDVYKRQQELDARPGALRRVLKGNIGCGARMRDRNRALV